jgi:signal transduction histidine kinase
MAKQVIFSLTVLLILIISQIVWFNQLWNTDQIRIEKEITEELSNILSFQNLKASSTKDTLNPNESTVKIRNGNNNLKGQSNINAYNSIDTKEYDSEKTLLKIVDNLFMDMSLEENSIKTAFVDSVFRKTYSHIHEVSYYSMWLLNGKNPIDSIYFGIDKKLFFNNKSSLFKIDIPLGSKKAYHFIAYFKLKPSAQVKNMFFSIGITSVAVVLVSILIIFQLIQLRRKTYQLQWREQAVSGIVHDLKSPLAYVFTMLGFFENLEKEDIKKQNFHTAKTRVKYLSDKVELILSAFKSNQDGLIINPAPYQFKERCEDMLDELKEIYKNKTIHADLAIPAGFSIEADNTYFESCIRNLLDNAVKYSPEMVHITISADINKGKACISIKDNGPGIPVNMQKKVFREFYRTESNSKVKGHGVGLSFTRQVVEAHKGKIFIDKNNQTGTEFKIIIPQNNHRI